MPDSTEKEIELVELQHERERGPGEFVLVNGTKYELSADGCISATVADAAKLQSGNKWRPKSYWDVRRDKIADATPPATDSGARRVRTRAELLAVADVNGIAMEEAEKSLDASAAIRDKDPEVVKADVAAQVKAEAEVSGEETITVSDDMTKTELLLLGTDIGLRINRNMSKAQILKAFEDAE